MTLNNKNHETVCDKINVVIEEKLTAGSLDKIEKKFYEASKKLGW